MFMQIVQIMSNIVAFDHQMFDEVAVSPVMGLVAQEAGGSLVHMEGAQVSKT